MLQLSDGKRGSGPERPAANAALPGSATVAVIRNPDRQPSQRADVALRKVRARTMTFVEREAEHLFEIAIVNKPLPVDAQQTAAHPAVEVRLLIGVAQQRHVFVEPTLRDE